MRVSYTFMWTLNLFQIWKEFYSNYLRDAKPYVAVRHLDPYATVAKQVFVANFISTLYNSVFQLGIREALLTILQFK